MMMQVWGSLVILIVCPLLGGLPVIDWITYAMTGRQLKQLGTGNISVSAAFYHGGKLVGILAVLSEALKGIGAVLLARAFFPTEPAWELIALIALIVGRYWMGKGAGTTNVVWGTVAHDPITAGLVFLISGISFTIFRDRASGRLGALILLVVILALRHPQDSERIIAAIALASLLAWIYHKIPDDLDLSTQAANVKSQKLFRFFRGNRAVLSLAQPLDALRVGQKAANLSQVKRWGYSVPDGWVLPAGDDPQPFIGWLPAEDFPLVVRSSAVGEDSETASAAGQYATILNTTSREALQTAIFDCLASYNSPAAIRYRQDRQQPERSMAVIVQKQIRGVFSGVAFSRDPVDQLDPAVVIEALPGDAAQVVSGKATPHQYRIDIQNLDNHLTSKAIPLELLHSVAKLTRELEDLYHGVPQDVEWTYDGQQLWVLQTRPITTLQPIWTRKIAAEVIPGVIRPLTWSINRPLTCGVWGEIFTLVLGRADDLDFTQTATLHFSRAYFNATLLGEIFRRMGLPPESLEFLTRGAKMSKPPLQSTLRNIPGLMRLLKREWRLEKDFEADQDRYFAPTLDELQERSPAHPEEILERIDTILSALKRATYYSILAPLSLSLRQAIFKVPDTELDNSQTPEVSSLHALRQLADNTRNLVPKDQLSDSASLFAHLGEMPDGDSILEQFDQWLNRYGYLSEAATDIAVPRWKDDPRSARDLFAQMLLSPVPDPQNEPTDQSNRFVQNRLQLKGQVTEVYSQLLAHLRWSFLALARQWQKSGWLAQVNDIFFLKLGEVRRLIHADAELRQQLPDLIEQRQRQFQEHQELNVPFVAYGNPTTLTWRRRDAALPQQQLQGIAASSGQVEGRVKVLRSFQSLDIDRQTILVVPYTDSGWSLLLARAGGLIAEVGGRLSHGAIVAREYGIPAVMDIHNATQLLQDGQRVRLDGQKGIVEILD